MRTILLLVAASAVGGCAIPLPTDGTDAGAQPVMTTRYVPKTDPQTAVSGYLWDPELFFLGLVNCGPGCPVPPLVMPGIPFFEQSLVAGATVSLFDPKTGAPALTAASPTDASGTFHLSHVPGRSDVPYFPMITPPAGYLATFTARPISTGAWPECLAISTLAASTAGILDAVAQQQSALGPDPVTPADLVDPSKYGGVGVVWAFQPGPASLRVPAFQTQVTASAGTVLAIDWAPPGVIPSGGQSARGFFVTGAAASPIGVSVVLLQPLAGPPSPVTLAVVDPSTDPGRPWTFPALPPMVLAPGVVTYLELPGLLPGPGGVPPAWVCLP